MPHGERDNGTVSAPRPLIVLGQVVDGFSFRFENGKIVDFSAKKGEDVIRKLLETDEGARGIGEVSLSLKRVVQTAERHSRERRLDTSNRAELLP